MLDDLHRREQEGVFAPKQRERKQQNQELVWEKGRIRKMENRFVTEGMDQGSGDSWFF